MTDFWRWYITIGVVVATIAVRIIGWPPGEITLPAKIALVLTILPIAFLAAGVLWPICLGIWLYERLKS